MESQATATTSLPSSVASSAGALLREHQNAIWRRTDRLLSYLLEFEWVLAIVLAVWRSPFTWQGARSKIHPHVWAALFLGGVIVIGPIMLVRVRPGEFLTRHTIAIGQMLMSGLLIHVAGGQIEMHFQIFGALAFLAFYRDWKVLVTASVVTAADHLLRGILIPESIYGLSYASIWLTLEHIAFVVFEDIFLIYSCVRGVREMRGIAENRALLEHSYHDIEEKVEQRTAELKKVQNDLLHAAHSAGMAEIATSVLHNVGNVLNSVNVSATLVADKLRQSEVASLGKVSEMMIGHKNDIADFLTIDERGKLIPEFIIDLAGCLSIEQINMMSEVDNLSKGIDHIKQIVAAQQSMAKKSNVSRAIAPANVMEMALSMQPPESANDVQYRKHFSNVPTAMLDQHKVLQVLINLITNAREAVMIRPMGQRFITLCVGTMSSASGERLQFQVTDNGMGIAGENLTRIFSHGFTTKKEGHGFGLHSAANAAREMGGSLAVSSAGENKGAAFTLDLPFKLEEEATPCSQ